MAKAPTRDPSCSLRALSSPGVRPALGKNSPGNALLESPEREAAKSEKRWEGGMGDEERPPLGEPSRVALASWRTLGAR